MNPQAASWVTLDPGHPTTGIMALSRWAASASRPELSTEWLAPANFSGAVGRLDQYRPHYSALGIRGLWHLV